MTETRYSPWFQALVVRPPLLCGVRLRPYSLAHELVLAELASPLLVKPATVSARDLYLAIGVCSRPVREIGDWLAADNERVARRWARKWGAHVGTAARSFRHYLDDYGNLPEIVQTGGERSKLDASPYWHAARILCQEYGYTLDPFAACALPCAWDAPKSLAFAAVDVWAESRGQAEIASGEEKQILDVVTAAKDALERGDTEAANALFDEANQMAAAMRERGEC